MAGKIQSVRSGQKVIRPPRSNRYPSPLDKAKGYELEWKHVAPVFDATRGVNDMTFTYFIGEADEGAVKIGLSKDPIARLRSMQTGNPRRLRVERLLVGTAHTEKMLHQIWEQHVIFSARTVGKLNAAPGTEWFKAEIRERLYPVIELATAKQIALLNDPDSDGDLDPDDFDALLRAAHGEFDITAHARDNPILLANTLGTVELGRRNYV